MLASIFVLIHFLDEVVQALETACNVVMVLHPDRDACVRHLSPGCIILMNCGFIPCDAIPLHTGINRAFRFAPAWRI